MNFDECSVALFQRHTGGGGPPAANEPPHPDDCHIVDQLHEQAAPLSFSELPRPDFLGFGILSRDTAGHEVLRGLTVEESQFVVHWRDVAPHHRTEQELVRLLGLLVKHEHARLLDATLDEPVVKNEARLG